MNYSYPKHGENYEEKVPKDRSKYKAYLWQKRVSKPNAEVQKSLEKWYEIPRASKALYKEAFEMCEYGTQPSEADIRRLFPMLKMD